MIYKVIKVFILILLSPILILGLFGLAMECIGKAVYAFCDGTLDYLNKKIDEIIGSDNQ